jgi:Tfp pilus assembly protein FimT
MIVIALIATLAGIASFYMTDYIRKSRLNEVTRNLDGDLAVIRNTARVRQLRNVVVVFPVNSGVINSYRAFVDANNNQAFDAGEETILEREFPLGVTLAVTSTTVGAVAPFTTVRYTALGTLSESNRVITLSSESVPTRKFQITVFTTGVTRVMRSDDSGTSFSSRAW